MIHAYDEQGTSLAELKAERDLLRDALHDATQNAANWRAAYADAERPTRRGDSC
jgi:hypothetical protein